MALTEELLAKLTTSLSGDIDTYNEVINSFQESENEVKTVTEELTETTKKLEDSEARGANYLGQISNLLSKIPVGETQTDVSFEQKVEAIKNERWER